MRELEPTEGFTGWEGRLDDDLSYTGADTTGWEASQWILHAMYVEKWPLRLARKARFGGASRSAFAVSYGSDDSSDDEGALPGGLTTSPGARWARRTWAVEIAKHRFLGEGCDFPPSFQWFDRPEWPVSVRPPGEGSLDRESLVALVDVLASVSERGLQTPVRASYAPFWNAFSGSGFTHRHFEGTLADVVALADEWEASPSNLWPADRSWFVFTDADLWGTKVSGDEELMAALRADTWLEVIEWADRPHPGVNAPAFRHPPRNVVPLVDRRRRETSPTSFASRKRTVRMPKGPSQ